MVWPPTEVEQLGFVVRFRFAAARGGMALVELMSALGDEVCQQRGLGFRGAGEMQRVELTITRFGDSATEEDRDTVSAWLGARDGIGALEVGPLIVVEV